MATIPTSIGIRQTPQPSQAVASYQPQRMNAGEVLASAGEEEQRAAFIVAQTNDRQDMMVAQDAANQLQAKAIDLQVGENGFANVKEGAAVGPKFIEDYTSKWTEEKERIRQGLTNPNQQRIFDQHADVGLLRYRGSLLSHQSQQTSIFNERTENDTIDLARRMVFANPGDPSAVQAAISKMDWAIKNKAERNGWDAQTTALTRDKYLGLVFKDAVSMMVEADPISALPLLNKRLGVGSPPENTGNSAIDGLQPQDLVELRHRADARVTVMANQANALEDRRLREAEEEVKNLRGYVMSGGLVSAEYAATVKAKTAGTPIEEVGNQLLQLSYMGAGFGSQPLGKQAESLRQADAARNQFGGDPESQKIYQHLVQINEEQKKAYKENPWAAYTRFGRGPEFPEVDFPPEQAPQVVKQRLQSIGAVEQYADSPASPFQPKEANSFATKLAGLTVPQQADILGAVGEQLNAPRIAALADQLDKNNKPLALSLKRGAGKTTADRAVAELILDGAQALKDGTVKADDAKVTGWRADIAAKVRGTLGSKEAEDEAIDMAVYVRASLARNGSAPTGFSGGGDTDQAVNLVVGQPMERGGVKTVLPIGMKQAEFDEKLKAVGPQVSETVYVRGVPVPRDQFLMRLPSMGLKRAGDGKYIPVTNNAFVTTDPNGAAPLVLDVR